jgi:hypothetical protein
VVWPGSPPRCSAGEDPEQTSYLVGLVLFVVWLALVGCSLVATAPAGWTQVAKVRLA